MTSRHCNPTSPAQSLTNNNTPVSHTGYSQTTHSEAAPAQAERHLVDCEGGAPAAIVPVIAAGVGRGLVGRGEVWVLQAGRVGCNAGVRAPLPLCPS